jgi:hypothetical protein
MYDFNPETRETNIDTLIHEYEAILSETGVLRRLKKSFANKTIMEKQCPTDKELNLITNRCVKRSKTRNTKVQHSSSNTRKNRA